MKILKQSQEGKADEESSPGGTPLTRVSPLQQRRHSHLELAAAATRASTSAHSFKDRDVRNRSNTGHY